MLGTSSAAPWLRLWMLDASLLRDALIAASLAAAADAVAQRLLGAKRLGVRRCCLMSLYGLCWYGPSNHVWQRLLVHAFQPSQAAGLLRHLQVIAQRVALDQLAYAPLNNSLMICYVALVADRMGWAAARAKVRQELPIVQLRGWRFWPCIQAINQLLVPLRFRVLVNSAAAVGWTAFVITRARSRRTLSHKLPVFDLKTGHITEKSV